MKHSWHYYIITALSPVLLIAAIGCWTFFASLPDKDILSGRISIVGSLICFLFSLIMYAFSERQILIDNGRYDSKPNGRQRRQQFREQNRQLSQ